MIHHLHNMTLRAGFLLFALSVFCAPVAEAHFVVTTALSSYESAEAPKNLSFIDPVWIEKTITGKVTDASDGTGLPGVNVLVKGTTLGTVTDLDGNYTLNAPDDAEVLVFSSVLFPGMLGITHDFLILSLYILCFSHRSVLETIYLFLTPFFRMV